MADSKMHADEIDIDTRLVRELLADQFSHWARLTLAPVVSAGTVNAIYRLGRDMAVRLPRIHWGVNEVNKEHEWLPHPAPPRCHSRATCEGPSRKRISMALVGVQLARR